MNRNIVICEEDFDVGNVLADMRHRCGAELGALVSFVGLVRDRNVHAGNGGEVSTLTLEHYPGMTESSIDKILDEAQTRWPLLHVKVIHRVGTLHPTDQIVLVAVASGHRDAAFAAAEFIMDYLKTKAVFWKKEQTEAGTLWVQSTQSDHARAQNWHTDKTINRSEPS